MKWLVIMAFLIVIVVSIWIFLFYRVFLNRRPNDIADQKRILLLYKTNHADLLSACKKLMQNKIDGLLDENLWEKDEFQIRINNPFDDVTIPKEILALDPAFIMIFNDNRVLIELVANYFSVSVQAFPEPIKNGGDKKLLDELWYSDIGYEKFGNFDKYLKDLKSRDDIPAEKN